MLSSLLKMYASPYVESGSLRAESGDIHGDDLFVNCAMLEKAIAEAMGAVELGVRFLPDHLEGDPYFRVRRPGQHLDRARAQLRGAGGAVLDTHHVQLAWKAVVDAEDDDIVKAVEAVTLDVIGRDKDDAAGLAEIKPKLVTTFKLRQSEVSKLVAQKDKVQLHKDIRASACAR